MSKDLIDYEDISSTLWYSRLITKTQQISGSKKLFLLILFSVSSGAIVEYKDSTPLIYSEAIGKCVGALFTTIILGMFLTFLHPIIYHLIKVISGYHHPVVPFDTLSAAFLAACFILGLFIIITYFT